MPRQTTPPADHPQAVLEEIVKLAHHIAIARKRRGETQAQWARRLGVSQPTMARIERGDPSVAMASYVMCMWLIDPTLGLADLIAPAHDRAALEREVGQVLGKPRQGGTKPGDSKRTHRVPVGGQGSSGHAPAAGLAALLNPGKGTSP
jgi:DNA-binding XRE family transcriptional regulator